MSRFIYCYTECHYARRSYKQCRYAECCYAECHYDECHYDECHYDDCHYAEYHYAECQYAEGRSTLSQPARLTLSSIEWKFFALMRTKTYFSLKQTFVSLAYYYILSSIVCTFFIENDAEILPAHYAWKVLFTNLIHKQSIQVKL